MMNKLIVMAMAILILSVSSVHALLVVEDFDTYEEGSLIYASGGSGFMDHWSSGNMNVVTGLNLSCSTTGYEVSSLGYGICTSTNVSGGLISLRKFSGPITGTTDGRELWFSTLVQPKSGARIGWNLNPTTQARISADAGFLVVGEQFRWLTNGVLVVTSESLAYNVTHLVMGRIVLKDTGLSTLSFWLNPADVTSTNALGATDITVSADFDGSIWRMGMEGYSGSAAMDALRISDGDGDATQAFRDVTRATSSVLYGPVEFASLHELTNNFALIDATPSDWSSADDENYGQGGYVKSALSASTHHTFVIDSDGAKGGGSDVFGECTIDFDCRQRSHYGVCFFGPGDPTSRKKKHWILISAGDMIRTFYNKTLGGGHSLEETDSSYSLGGSEWRHVRMDVRRTNNFTQVEARVRVWDNPSDFREEPDYDNTFIYPAGHSHPYSDEIAFTSYYEIGVGGGEIDNLAVYRYDTAPDWFMPKGTLILLQ